MTVDRQSIERAIGARKLADWIITERKSERLVVERGSSGSSSGADELWRSDRAEHLRVLVRRDLPSGRGTGIVSAQEHIGDAPSLVARAVALAEAAVEPAWDTPPPAAPARVELFDETFGESLEQAAAALASALGNAAAAAKLTVERWRGEVIREDHVLSSVQGFDVSWRASRYQLVAQLRGTGAGTAPLITVRRAARRLADLDLAASLTAAAATAAARGRAPITAAAVPAQPVHLQLGPDAMLEAPLAGDLAASSPYVERGVWGAFIALADTVAARRGLQRSGQRGTDSSLTVWSDGAMPYGLRSAPIGEEGEAVRRFRLWSAGAPGEPGLGPRAAALLGAAPNGGVRNLAVNAGEAEAPAAAPILHVHRLRLLHLDATSGRAELELALAEDREHGAIYTHGTCSIDLAHALAAAARSSELVRRGDYHGPRWVRLPPVLLR